MLGSALRILTLRPLELPLFSEFIDFLPLLELNNGYIDAEEDANCGVDGEERCEGDVQGWAQRWAARPTEEHH